MKFNINPDMEKILDAALDKAHARGNVAYPQDFLLELMGDKGFKGFAIWGRINRAEISRELEASIERLPGIALDSPRERGVSSELLPLLSLAAKGAELHKRQAGWQEILIAYLFGNNQDASINALICGHILRRHGVTTEKMRRFLAGEDFDGADASGPAASAEDGAAPQGSSQGPSQGSSVPPAPVIAEGKSLAAYCTNLNRRAAEGGLDPMIGRQQELREAIIALGQRKKSNPLFIGDSGVGKTAMAEGLAAYIAENGADVPQHLRHAPVFSLDMGKLTAGTRYRGDFEERLEGILKDLKQIREEHGIKPILFIDEIHTLVGAGATSGGAMDASNIMKPALASGELRCMGSTTFKEYRQYFEKDKALVRRFQPIDVTEPSIAEAVQILRGLRRLYESHHNVTFTDAAIETAVKLAKRHLIQHRLPDSAVAVLDKAGATLSSFGKTGEVGPQAIAEAVAMISHKKLDQVMEGNDAETLLNLEKTLNEVVIDQPKAVKELVTALKMSRAGLRSPDKTVGSYLFSGPTGVGKTEVSKQLAASLGIELVRFDMSEYMEKHTVSRLIGAPPGYVGFDQGGLLTDAIDQKPHCVLLLDEIEKAHPDLYNILLQVMDNGRLTDHNGKSIDFRNVILIMTTNAGAAALTKESAGFRKQESTADVDAIKALFTPEFRNRLDAIVPFAHLSPEAIAQVAEKFIKELKGQLAERNVTLDIGGDAMQFLVDNGYDRLNGARPMARLIQQQIKVPLADEILFGALKGGGSAKASFAAATGDKPAGLRFAFNKAAAPGATPQNAPEPRPAQRLEPAPF